jgi:hypothetical protein
MERNTIELTAHTITIVDENTAIKFAVPDPVCTGGIKEVPAFEKYNVIAIIPIYPPHKPQRLIFCGAQLVHVTTTIVGPGSVCDISICYQEECGDEWINTIFVPDDEVVNFEQVN